MNIEEKRIEGWLTGKGSIGHITLDKLAIPETVKVTLDDEILIPESFDIYGHPNFTEEQERLFSFKEDDLERKVGKYVPLKAKIEYEERIFDVPRDSFDTISGIEKSLTNLSDLNEMLNNRRLFHKAHENERLNEFMILGCFHLDVFGQVMSVPRGEMSGLYSYGIVERFEDFCENNETFSLSSNGYAIPNANSVCPCCGRPFTIDDMKRYEPCIYVNGKYYHYHCHRKYRRLMEVDKLTRQLMDMVYKNTDYSFELLRNGYCTGECCSHIPWILFHTVDGDIIMGWRKRVISIEWQENYKAFDMKELFGTEDVTKWKEGEKRGIHAWGDAKAFEYLEKVRKVVNPKYSKY